MGYLFVRRSPTHRGCVTNTTKPRGEMGATKWILAGAMAMRATAASSTSGNVNPYTGAAPAGKPGGGIGEAASVGSSAIIEVVEIPTAPFAGATRRPARDVR